MDKNKCDERKKKGNGNQSLQEHLLSSKSPTFFHIFHLRLTFSLLLCFNSVRHTAHFRCCKIGSERMSDCSGILLHIWDAYQTTECECTSASVNRKINMCVDGKSFLFSQRQAKTCRRKWVGEHCERKKKSTHTSHVAITNKRTNYFFFLRNDVENGDCKSSKQWVKMCNRLPCNQWKVESFGPLLGVLVCWWQA